MLQDLDELETAESDQCSIEDYYRIVKQIYQNAIKQVIEQVTNNITLISAKNPLNFETSASYNII